MLTKRTHVLHFEIEYPTNLPPVILFRFYFVVCENVFVLGVLQPISVSNWPLPNNDGFSELEIKVTNMAEMLNRTQWKSFIYFQAMKRSPKEMIDKCWLQDT